MKKSIKYLGVAMMGAFALSSCSEKFLDEKQNYEQVGQDVYNYYSGALGRINDIYGLWLPNVPSGSDEWRFPSAGDNDYAGKSTEEYAGLSDFVEPETEMSSTTKSNEVMDFFGGQDMGNIQNATYGAIRDINNAIEGIEGSTLSTEDKNKLLGQAYFFRGYWYSKLVKWYGGIPLVDKVLEPSPNSFTPRSSAKACIDFIVADLDKAAELLLPFTGAGGWESADYGRVTSGTALALKGRVLTLWCSPLFNRKGDVDRYQEAYEEMLADKSIIDGCGYGLFGEGDPGVNGSTFAKMFATTGRNPEAVFTTLFNTIVDFSGLGDAVKHNRWERYIRPDNTGGTGKTPSKMIVDLFPMSDGKLPSSCGTYTRLDKSSIAYDEQHPFMNRDPRFYRTFAFPGVRWAYKAGGNGDATAMNANNPSYNNGQDYVLWNYVWFYSGSPTDINNTEYRGADNMSKPGGIMVRKKSDDNDVNTPAYDYRPDGQGAKNGGYAVPFCSSAPLMELRYAEVLLNLAEVACGAGHPEEAVPYLQRIRARAGYTAANNYGLQANLSSDQQACMAAILYERQIEFAFEGKRFDDCRRWMLYDGGAVKVPGAPDSWTLTGWGGNTCTWLGFKPLNGQRRETFIYRVADDSYVAPDNSSADSNDPVKVNRPAAGVDLMADNLQEQLENLKAWYDTNLKYMKRRGDSRYSSTLEEKTIDFRPQYYFLGFKKGVSEHNVGLPQTIGWGDVNTGGMGTFDPFEN